MPTQEVGKDARGRTASVDDYVIDKKGQAAVVAWTEKALRKREIARATPVMIQNESSAAPALPDIAFVRLGKVFRVRQPRSQRANKARWRRLYDKYVRPIKREATRKRRKAEATTTMWHCPVCANGRQPTRFKIGVQVWKGRRLRVCSTPCKRRVLRGVKQLQQAHSDLDPEYVRRQIAYQYMKAGRQKVGDSLC